VGHLKGGSNLFEKVELIDPTIFSFLFLGIFANCLFISAYGRDMVSSGPEMLSCKILFAPRVLPRNVDGTFALDETDHLGNRIFGWVPFRVIDVGKEREPFR
jgi:hypothetical protein